MPRRSSSTAPWRPVDAGEQVKLVADWVGGDNELGYVTPGVSVEIDPWTLQLGYSIKNEDSRGNGVLFQAQAKF